MCTMIDMHVYIVDLLLTMKHGFMELLDLRTVLFLEPIQSECFFTGNAADSEQFQIHYCPL